ncbi:ABC transporter transmembrane domain-containing protein [Fictibacillus phosphorivorans]|uniref:ABC transporter transmembrane domain-containing protein n=1 Tax=Fictibacillus phosphorivorans TaxID=1221500 RepID=UPI00203D7AAF|nr:ABC transporter transmembrane domain-containing protein [Fictibacillus phosphorivorans]MCM3717051.1 ABC transporter transmembrane domain-containing protein [Fictibacillus phosphorivorans]MCM3774738.1 ABC transporter transmembrane domain-containing protein [Fictibacillus phosphorivorans]
MKVFIQLMWFFKQERIRYVGGIVMLAFVSLGLLVPPKIVGLVVDHIKEGTLTEDLLWRYGGLLIAIAIGIYVLRYIWRILIFGAAVKLAMLLRNKLYEHFTKKSQEFYQKRRVGDLMAHSTNDLQAIQQTAGDGVLTLVDSLMMGGFTLIAMATTISWKLTLVSLLPLPVMAWATNKYGTMLHKRFHSAQEAFSSLNDKVQESISGTRVIKAFGQEEDDIKSFNELSKDAVRKNMAVARIDSMFDPTISLIIGFSFFLAVSYGSSLVIKDDLTIGELVSFTSYLGLLIWPMLAFGWLFNIVERGRASYDRIESLLAVREEIEDEGTLDKLPKGNIEFHLKEFRYPGKDSVLKDVHFTLQSGQSIGVVGKTGSGKTTLCRMLLREHHIKRGNVFIDGEDICDYRLQTLRSAIGYVPQDHFLFSATIAENIAFGKIEATFAEIKGAAQTASIHKDITQFKYGYETVVGERGVTLSGGQKQRISIARSLVIDPEILILDDSLSAVDAKTEEEILHNLKEERKDKTTIITAHRLSSIAHCDLIVVMDNGTIVQRGTHQSLLCEEGWYKETYERQALETLIAQGGGGR